LTAKGEVEAVFLTSEQPAGVGVGMLQAIHDAQSSVQMPPEAACISGETLSLYFELNKLGARH
jgi:hypothetical protein